MCNSCLDNFYPGKVVRIDDLRSLKCLECGEVINSSKLKKAAASYKERELLTSTKHRA